jgi:serine/threonine protein phosphatase 1
MHNRLFAIGDIHGCFNSLKKLMEEKMQITQSDKVVLLGDYIDRGSQSRQVIDYIIELKDKGFDIIALRGNHEEMLLEAYNEELVSRWILNGGSETLKSFGIKSIKELEPNYLDFFRSLPLFFEFNHCLFVHAGFNDEIQDPFEDTYHMIWRCREKYIHPLLKDKTIVHGHCVIPAPVCDERIRNKDRVIDLDTGCVFSNYSNYGRLTALEINTGDIFSV